MPRVFASSLARCFVATPLAAPVRIWPMRSDWRTERSSPGSGSKSMGWRRGRGRARGRAPRARPAAVPAPHLAHAVGLEGGEELPGLRIEEHGVEAGAAPRDGVGLE